MHRRVCLRPCPQSIIAYATLGEGIRWVVSGGEGCLFCAPPIEGIKINSLGAVTRSGDGVTREIGGLGSYLSV